MKNSFNISLQQDTQTCGLCQDTLLRHINQSRVFWYCPSCRQEMVGEGPENPCRPSVRTQLEKTIVQHQARPKVASQRVIVRAS